MEAAKQREKYSPRRNVTVSEEEVARMLLEAVRSTRFEGVTVSRHTVTSVTDHTWSSGLSKQSVDVQLKGLKTSSPFSRCAPHREHVCAFRVRFSFGTGREWRRSSCSSFKVPKILKLI